MTLFFAAVRSLFFLLLLFFHCNFHFQYFFPFFEFFEFFFFEFFFLFTSNCSMMCCCTRRISCSPKKLVIAASTPPSINPKLKRIKKFSQLVMVMIIISKILFRSVPICSGNHTVKLRKCFEPPTYHLHITTCS